MAHRRDFPVCRTKPITCVRYACGSFVIRATAEGVFVDSEGEGLTPSQTERVAMLKKLARERHRQLKDGQQPSAKQEPKWIDTEEARTT